VSFLLPNGRQNSRPNKLKESTFEDVFVIFIHSETIMIPPDIFKAPNGCLLFIEVYACIYVRG
jgi:hypothetical protein